MAIDAQRVSSEDAATLFMRAVTISRTGWGTERNWASGEGRS